MTDEPRRLTGAELEQFFTEHGGRESFEKYREESGQTDAVIDVWEDGAYQIRFGATVMQPDFQVYLHEGALNDITQFLRARIEATQSEADAYDARLWKLYGSGRGVSERVVGDTQCKMALIDQHQPDESSTTGARCKCCVDPSAEGPNGLVVGVPYPCDTLRALTAIYSSHPDYRQEWAIGTR